MPRNYLYGELLGSSYFYSINYERNIVNAPAWGINLRAGFGFAPTTANSWYTFSGHFLLGRKFNFLDITSGITYVNATDKSFAFPEMISWRHHFKNTLFVRTGLCIMPLYQKSGLEGMLIWPGLSFGKGF